MKLDELNRLIREIKSQGNCITNAAFTDFTEESLIQVEYNSKALIYVVKKDHYNKAFFYTTSVEELNKLIGKIKIPFLLFFNCKDKDDKTLSSLGLKMYSLYVRDTVRYTENPYLMEETNKRRRILKEMYDPNCGEYAQESDAEELLDLSKELFDDKSDEIPSLTEWREICKNRECLIYREDNVDEGNPIIAFYVWHLEGKKLYSRMSANKFTANILYNLERRIFTDYFDKGIRVFYGWSDYYYSAAHGRRSDSSSKLINRIYCQIYSNVDEEKKRRKLTYTSKE